ncbi:hypothetical protein QVD17_42281 [Tagetes erecta]|uniref:Uncharacterized protein n=1 Tax=Tagetes erecta TaxID=13708 RepID=A0AAD8NDL1_TARER|nr:hypothetical protein QVD17_42281 [Tagetes erecta]
MTVPERCRLSLATVAATVARHIEIGIKSSRFNSGGDGNNGSGGDGGDGLWWWWQEVEEDDTLAAMVVETQWQHYLQYSDLDKKNSEFKRHGQIETDPYSDCEEQRYSGDDETDLVTGDNVPST